VSDAEKLDLSQGVRVDRIEDGGIFAGQAGGEEVILVRRGDEFFAVGANCTHYGGPLAKGLVVGDQVRCPLHHACFDLRTGEALRAPAFDPIPCWRVERVGNKLFVREKTHASDPKKRPKAAPESVVIVGGGAAGLAAAEMLRRQGYDGPVTMISADDSAPVDRPNLSKDYLTGEAQDEWIPLRTPDFYKEQKIDLILNTRVASIDAAPKRVSADNGKLYRFDALLLATGAEPVKLTVPGADDARVQYLRTYSDSKALIKKAKSAKQVVIVGGSFIALEVAASLRESGVAVHVVAPDKIPFEKTLGAQIGQFMRKLHESHGVAFHLGEKIAHVGTKQVTLSGGSKIDADFLLVGIGVKPATELAERAGLRMDRGVLVNEYLETSAPGIFAAGDIARWPDAQSGENIRIEHWVVAERQGQVAAQNILGHREKFDLVPYFWTKQYDVSVRYSGHAEKWDSVDIEGKLEAKDCAVTYKLGGRAIAMATIERDKQNLKFEAAMETPARRKSAP
jgi:NADPH-dependent 2,4-dienoyl-CoA reductase/sulfur reductase-like enzyme/nitrite reductase/ring-hydroxylating ferredoxin subunit